jgi:hypothetical protein
MNAILALLIVTAHADSTVKPGEAIRIEGKVVDATGNPASNCDLVVSIFDHSNRMSRKAIHIAKSDRDGAFALDLVVPRDENEFNETATVWALRDDASIAGYAFYWKKPPEKPITIKLGRKNQDAIVVLDFFGKPVEGVRIAPIVLHVDGLPSRIDVPPEGLIKRLGATTDADGKALIENADPSSIELLEAKSPRLGKQRGAVPSKGKPFRLEQVGRIRGRLKADDPKAVQGRIVIVSNDQNRFTNENPKSSIEELITDREGNFDIPEFITGRFSIRVDFQGNSNEYRAPRFSISGILDPGETIDLTIPLVGPPKLRPEALAGRILDSKGDPVPGATVFSRGDTFKTLSDITDRDGAYRLEGVPRGRAFIFVRKPGYRFAGADVPEDKSVLDLMIRRDDEKIDRPLKSLPTPLDAKERYELAGKILDPYIEKLSKRFTQPELNNALRIAALFDPERVLDLAEKNVFKDEGYNDNLRGLAAKGMTRVDVDEALAVVESINDIGNKVSSYLDIIDSLPADRRLKKLEILARARLQAENQKDPMQRIGAIAWIADLMFDLGEDAQATKILGDSIETARKLNDEEGFTIANFAKTYAILDPASALDLIKNIRIPQLSVDAHGWIAHEIAARHPEESERILNDLSDPFFRDLFSMRVAYRMARRDFDRARRIASLIRPNSARAYTLGVMAENLAQSNHQISVSLIKEAFDILEKRVEQGPQIGIPDQEPEDVAAALISVVEKIDPTLVDEFFWRAISFRTLGERDYERENRERSDSFLAAILARFNPAIARLLIEPIDVSTIDPFLYNAENPLTALMSIDPRRTIALLDQIPEPDRVSKMDFKNQARMAFASMLTHQDEEYWKYIVSHFTGLWIPDIENLSSYP